MSKLIQKLIISLGSKLCSQLQGREKCTAGAVRFRDRKSAQDHDKNLLQLDQATQLNQQSGISPAQNLILLL